MFVRCCWLFALAVKNFCKKNLPKFPAVVEAVLRAYSRAHTHDTGLEPGSLAIDKRLHSHVGNVGEARGAACLLVRFCYLPGVFFVMRIAALDEPQ